MRRERSAGDTSGLAVVNEEGLMGKGYLGRNTRRVERLAMAI